MEILAKYNGKAPIIINQVYNRCIKEIAAILGINKHLSSHVARKTFGCLCIAQGASMDTTTKMLARTDVRETAKIYAELDWQRIHKEIPHMFIQRK